MILIMKQIQLLFIKKKIMNINIIRCKKIDEQNKILQDNKFLKTKNCNKK